MRCALMAVLLAGLVLAPTGAAQDPTRIAVVSQDAGTLSLIDATAGGAPAAYPVGTAPAGIAVSPGGVELYVAFPDGKCVGVVDRASGEPLRSLPVQGQPFGVAADDRFVFVSDWSSDRVLKIDAANGRLVGEAEVGRSPAGIALAGGRLYVANRESGTVSVVETASMRVLAAIAAGDGPYALAVSPDGHALYVVNVRSDDIAVIDTAMLTRTARVAAGRMPYGVAVTPDGADVLVTSQHGNVLTIIDAARLKPTGEVAVGRYPEGVVADGDGKAYVANWFSDDVSVIDIGGRRELARIKVGAGPRFLALVAPTAGVQQ
jgi:YVTN family beta-propeller protein